MKIYKGIRKTTLQKLAHQFSTQRNSIDLTMVRRGSRSEGEASVVFFFLLVVCGLVRCGRREVDTGVTPVRHGN